MVTTRLALTNCVSVFRLRSDDWPAGAPAIGASSDGAILPPPAPGRSGLHHHFAIGAILAFARHVVERTVRRGVERRIESALGDQRLVRTLLDDAAGLQHDD